jgi:hypothetical protein
MRGNHLRLLVPSLVAALALAACTGSTNDTTPTSRPAPTSANAIDPLQPYSPATTPFVERQSGFIPDTLTLPTSEGGKLYVTPVTTTMTTTFEDGTRALAVYLTLENAGDATWSGNLGADAEIRDLNDATFAAEPPDPGDEHPHPGTYGGVNRDLLRTVTVPTGDILKGVLVFHPTGGNRPITLRISADGGTTWAEWTTALGVS